MGILERSQCHARKQQMTSPDIVTRVGTNSHPSNRSLQHLIARKPCIYELPTRYQVCHPPTSAHLLAKDASTVLLAPLPMQLSPQRDPLTPMAPAFGHQPRVQRDFGPARSVSVCWTKSSEARASLPSRTIGWKPAMGLQTTGSSSVRTWRQWPQVCLF